jgi:imidazolonepropionase-like amidohydrolase
MLGLRFSRQDLTCLKQLHGNDLKLTAALHRAGVPLLAGTDTPNPDCLPGYGLHDELELLVKAGLSPLEALQTATLNPARFLHVSDRQGTVEVGKIADVVLLNADPLVEINNIRSIHTVFLDGRPLRPEEVLKPWKAEPDNQGGYRK